MAKKRWTKTALMREPAVQKVVDRLTERIIDLMEQQARALKDDEPTGRCASYHRGNIAALQLVLREVHEYRPE